MAGRFAEGVVLITGAASGIGEATAHRFAAEGARVIVADIDVDGGRRVAKETDGRFESVDVAEEASLRSTIERIANEMGRLDVLVSNAFASGFGPVATLDTDAWRLTLDVTLTAVFAGLKAALPVMRRQGAGAVVNVASISGMAGDRGLAAYNAAKAGVINLTRTAALELAAENIRVNAVCPGLIDTPALRRAFGRLPGRRERAQAVVPMKRFGSPDEIARTILFLASADASYVTGATLVVDGGLTAGTGIPDIVPDD